MIRGKTRRTIFLHLGLQRGALSVHSQFKLLLLRTNCTYNVCRIHKRKVLFFLLAHAYSSLSFDSNRRKGRKKENMHCNSLLLFTVNPLFFSPPRSRPRKCENSMQTIRLRTHTHYTHPHTHPHTHTHQTRTIRKLTCSI